MVRSVSGICYSGGVVKSPRFNDLSLDVDVSGYAGLSILLHAIAGILSCL